MSMLGHNQGPTMERGAGWRRYAWRRARADLLPKLPLEVVRLRVKRARELGLDYRSYASIRAANGRDVVAFLFSSNALRVDRETQRPLPVRQDKLEAIRQCERLALVAPASALPTFAETNAALFAAMQSAPTLSDTWPEIRAKVGALTSARGLPPDGVVVIGETHLERDWLLAGRLGGYISADRYFGAPE